MLKTDVLFASAFSESAQLYAELSEVIAPSYENAAELLARELRHCDALYTGRDETGRLVCFFMTAQETLELPGGGHTETLYLGLSATRQDSKGDAQVSALYERCLEDAWAWESEHQRSLLLWATTASPLPYLVANGYLQACEPTPGGDYSDAGATFAAALRARFFPQCPDHPHPFVLENAAANTRYSTKERQEIERICKARRFMLFERLGIDERNGDRLLFIARTPSKR